MPTTRALAPIFFSPDTDSPEPLYRQLGTALLGDLRAGSIRLGDRLPSERDLAERLQVSRTTVTAAYQELKDLGLLRGYVGRGVIVIANDTDQTQAGVVPWAQLGARFMRHAPQSSQRHSSTEIPLADGWLNPGLIPRAALAACAASAAAQVEQLGTVTSPLGLPEPDPVTWTPRSTKSVIHGRLVRSLATNRNRPAVGNAVPPFATTLMALGVLTQRASAARILPG
jgi:DNA-binding transcriptional regulator YhcF (GntR family)